MLNTLAQRCHRSLTSGDISDLVDEINNHYTSGNITYILGSKLTSELCKRKRVLWHDYSCDLSFPSSPGSESFFLLEGGSGGLLLENNSDYLLLQS